MDEELVFRVKTYIDKKKDVKAIAKDLDLKEEEKNPKL